MASKSIFLLLPNKRRQYSLSYPVFCAQSAVTRSLSPIFSVHSDITQSLSSSQNRFSVSLRKSHIYSFSLLVSMDKLISQNGENALNKLHEDVHTLRKAGFCYYCQVFYPDGKTKYEVIQNNTYNEKRSTSVTSGDRTTTFLEDI